MKKKQMIAAALTAALLFSQADMVQARSANTQILPSDHTEIAQNCMEAGVEGEYITEAEAVLERINAIRQEACQEGVPNPQNPSEALTMNDYKPMQWSSDLEYVARIRAAEASIVPDHIRTSGASCFDINSPNHVSGGAEVLAWNFSKTMLSGVNQWYEEKKDWVSQNASAVTGHYTSMINPRNIYVGVGTFYSADGVFPNSTCGRFASGGETDGSYMPPVTDVIQKIQIQTSLLKQAAIKQDYIISGDSGSRLAVGDRRQYSLHAVTSYQGSESRVTLLGNQTWTSSDSSVLEVDSTGVVSAKKGGFATIAARVGSFTSSLSITVEKGPQTSADSSGEVKSGDTNGGTGNKKSKVTMKKTMLKSVTAGKRKLVVRWKKGAKNVTGYQLQCAANKKFKRKTTKTLTINGRKKTKATIKKLKAKKKYYVRIRTVGKRNGKKYYSAWSAVKSKTIK